MKSSEQDECEDDGCVAVNGDLDDFGGGIVGEGNPIDKVAGGFEGGVGVKEKEDGGECCSEAGRSKGCSK